MLRCTKAGVRAQNGAFRTSSRSCLRPFSRECFPRGSQPSALAGLTLGALGVVYGDIGTSPLYALKEVFHGGHIAATPENILGVLSLLFWTITVVVSISMCFDPAGRQQRRRRPHRHAGPGHHGREGQPAAPRADDRGSLWYRHFLWRRRHHPGHDGARRGRGHRRLCPEYHDAILPLTLIVIAGLFAVQRFGTGGIGKAFGPVMLTWFLVLALLVCREC